MLSPSASSSQWPAWANSADHCIRPTAIGTKKNARCLVSSPAPALSHDSFTRPSINSRNSSVIPRTLPGMGNGDRAAIHSPA